MADEAQYSSGHEANNNNSAKRKYEEEPQLRRATGFSAPISSQSRDANKNNAPASYNNVPPPTDEFQIAKRRAQEIAARLINSASAQNGAVGGAGGGGGYDSGDKGFSSAASTDVDYGQKAYRFSSTPPPPPAPVQSSASYGGYQSGPSKKIEIPNGRVGVIIGKGGETIKTLQAQSIAKIQVQRDAEADMRSMTRLVELTGTPDKVDRAEQLIQEVLREAESGGSGTIDNRRFNGEPGSEQFSMQIPNNKVGLFIGKGGETIKSMQAQTGARIQVIPLHLPPGDPATERRLQIDGTSEQIEQAKQLVYEVISESKRYAAAQRRGQPETSNFRMGRSLGVKGKKKRKLREAEFEKEASPEVQFEEQDEKRAKTDVASQEDEGVGDDVETAHDDEMPGIPVALQDPDTRKNGVIFVLEKVSLEVGKVGKGYQLLSAEEHSNFLRKNNKDPNDYRPDIAHQALLHILDSPLNKAGRVRAVYVKTQKGVLFEVKPHVRLPRTYKRFAGLMLQLLQKLSVTATTKREKLLRVIKNPVTQYLPAGSRKIGFSFSSEKSVTMENYMSTVGNDENLVFVLGAMSHGKIDQEYTDDFISVSDYPLSAAWAIAIVCMAVQKKWKIH